MTGRRAEKSKRVGTKARGALLEPGGGHFKGM